MPESLTQHDLWQSVNSQVYSNIPHFEASKERWRGLRREQHSAPVEVPYQWHLVSSHPNWLCVCAMDHDESLGSCCVSLLSVLGSIWVMGGVACEYL